jgi:hypothetical protein
MDDLRYPVGTFEAPKSRLTEAERAAFIAEIADAPRALRAAVQGLDPDQVETAYRPGGWTVRQVVHHVPDSHMNAYVRWKLALTEDEPTIKPYAEDRWARLPDVRWAPLDTSLDLLDKLHQRWVLTLRDMAPEEWTRRLTHPDHGTIDLDWMAAQYAWHGRHHVAHVTSLRRRMGWP